jgi:hypothetical protein
MGVTRKLIVSASAAGALLGAAVGPASADPTNAKNSETFDVVCANGLGTLPISTNGNGTWTPGHVTSSNQVLIPYELHISGSFTPSDGGPTETFTDDNVKKAPHNGRLASCTFSVSGSDEFGSFTFGGTVLVSYTPAH